MTIPGLFCYIHSSWFPRQFACISVCDSKNIRNGFFDKTIVEAVKIPLFTIADFAGGLRCAELRCAVRGTYVFVSAAQTACPCVQEDPVKVQKNRQNAIIPEKGGLGI